MCPQFTEESRERRGAGLFGLDRGKEKTPEAESRKDLGERRVRPSDVQEKFSPVGFVASQVSHCRRGACWGHFTPISQ